MKFLIIFFLLTSVCFAKDIQVGSKIYNADEKYSWKDFTGRTLQDAKDLDNKIIFGSCFSQEIPDTKVFPDDMKNVTFIGGNLDNVFIPAGNIVIGSTQRRFKVQNDRSDWILDKDNKPIEPIDKEKYIELGLSIDSKDLPKDMMDENIIEKKQKELNK
jgi:hypothetical protein